MGGQKRCVEGSGRECLLGEEKNPREGGKLLPRRVDWGQNSNLYGYKGKGL